MNGNRTKVTALIKRT